MKKVQKIGHNQNPIQEKLEKSFKKILTGIRLIDGAQSDYYTAEELSGCDTEPFHELGWNKLYIAEQVLLTALNTVEDVLKDEYKIPYKESLGLNHKDIKEGDITKKESDLYD